MEARARAATAAASASSASAPAPKVHVFSNESFLLVRVIAFKEECISCVSVGWAACR